MCKFARAKLLKLQKNLIVFCCLALEMVKFVDYRAISPRFHELAQLIFCGISSYILFITLVFRVVLCKDQLCLSQMMNNFKVGGM